MQIDGKEIAVIGGAGFVGSHIVDQLLDTGAAKIKILDNFVRGSRENLRNAARDERVEIIEGSMTDRALLDRVLEGVDGVFLLAALWLFECVHEPRAAMDVNVGGTYNVIEAATAAGVKKLVFSSSASVYGDALTTPMTEEHPFNNRTMYGATKIAGEQFLRAANEQNDLDYVGLRYMNIYGPRMDYKGTYVSVIMKVLDRIDAGDRPVIFGDGSQAYDFVHVDDVASCNLLAMQSETSDAFYNVGTGIKTTINELVGILLEVTDSELEPEFKPQEQMFVTHRVGSTQKAKEELGFAANKDLRQGLESVVRWRQADQERPSPSE